MRPRPHVRPRASLCAVLTAVLSAGFLVGWVAHAGFTTRESDAPVTPSQHLPSWEPDGTLTGTLDLVAEPDPNAGLVFRLPPARQEWYRANPR